MIKIIFRLVVVVLLMSTPVLAQNTTIHTDGLTVNGTVESTIGGVIFPDGTVQETAFTYLGEFCSEAVAGPDILLTKLNVYETAGGNNYILSGKQFKNGVLHNVFSGSGVLNGSNIHMVLSHSGKDSVAIWTGICTGATDTASFSSTTTTTVECISHDYNYADLTLDTQYSTGSSTAVVCP
jgi:hypothetical protein